MSNVQYVSMLGLHQYIEIDGAMGPSGAMSYCTMFTRYISVGAFNLEPSEKVIEEVNFSIDEGRSLSSHREPLLLWLLAKRQSRLSNMPSNRKNEIFE